MYKIIFDKYLTLLNWHIIYYGIKNNLIDLRNAIDYAHKLVEYNVAENESLIVNLLIVEDAEKNEILSLIEENLSLNDIDTELCNRILRYIILDEINQIGENILDKIEDVYADFNYPEDMNSFIRYMPAEDKEYNPQKHTKEENEQRLINKFNEFLQNELMSFN